MFRVSIVDTDDNTVSRLNSLLSQYAKERNVNFYVRRFTDAESCLATLENEKEEQVLFSDISLPKMDGIRLVDELRQRNTDVAVIYCSEKVDAAVDAFRVGALGFLPKPFPDSLFTKYLDRVVQYKQAQALTEDKLRLRSVGDNQYVLVSDVCYVEVKRHYLYYHIRRRGKEEEAEVIRVRGKISDAETMLAQKGFARCGISFLVNLKQVTSIVGNDVYFGKMKLPISRNYKKAFVSLLSDSVINS